MLTAFDTETYRGKAILLVVPDGWTEPKNWQDCIDFCRNRRMIAYNMDYDFQALLTYVPRDIRNRLSHLGEVTFGDYEIKYVKKKFAKVHHKGKLQFVMYDMAQFHNTSLNNAAKRFGLVWRKADINKAWYRDMRSRLNDPKTRRKVLEYALQDARLLQSLVIATSAKFDALGVPFRNPISNAIFAQRVFADGFKGYKVPFDIESMAREAFYGGRIEIFRAGSYRFGLLYDIRSAYPSVMTKLVRPDGLWLWNKVIRDDAEYAFVDCTIEVSHDAFIGPVAMRDHLGISYPSGTFRRILTLPEYRLVKSFPPTLGGKVRIKRIHRSVQHVQSSGIRPFAKIDELYAARLENPDVEYAVKIILNSLFGKTSQTQKVMEPTDVINGDSIIVDEDVFKVRRKRKPTTSLVYASHITAAIRCQITSAVRPDSLISISTDGILCTKPLDHLRLSKKLGDWGVEPVRNILVIGSGVYEYTKTGKDGKPERVTRFRGFASRFNLKKMLKEAGYAREISVTLLRNTSLVQARRNPKAFNCLEDIERILRLNFDKKRYWREKWTASDLLLKQFTSETLITYPGIKLPFVPMIVRKEGE